jgi:hypothetical protein
LERRVLKVKKVDLAASEDRMLPSLALPPASPYTERLPGLPGSFTARAAATFRFHRNVVQVNATRGSLSMPASPQRSTAGLGAQALSAKNTSLDNMSTGLFSLASAAGNLSARGTTGLRWSAVHGRPLVGSDCPPEVGQRVVGVAQSAFKNMGLGTIVNVDGCSRGFAAVAWDRERGSARPPAEYCVGHQGVYLLELAQLEDIVSEQRYESLNCGQGMLPARSLEDIFNEPFGGTGRKRRLQIKPRTSTTADSWQSSLTDTTKQREFLKRGQGLKVSTAKYQPNRVTKTLTELFILFGKGTKRKRTWGYNIGAVKVQTMQSMNLRELVQCLNYLDVRQDKTFLRGQTPILTTEGIQAQYDHYAPWSHPDAFQELDFDRFALCIEAVAILVGIPLSRFICVPPHDERGKGIAAGLARRGIVPKSTVDPLEDDTDDEDHVDKTKNTVAPVPADSRPAFAPAGHQSYVLSLKLVVSFGS